MRSVINKLFFLKKIKIYKEIRCEKKKVEGLNCFWVTWSPSLLRDQAFFFSNTHKIESGVLQGKFLERLEKKFSMQHTKLNHSSHHPLHHLPPL